ncbi:uncharacterized protein LOC135425132 [Pseudopipra pipra]|uniref:uncharacterized protein LOC135425132 n=1 Tax=Pseudopipra pipra TaxID=415032 RepID=UPI003138B918
MSGVCCIQYVKLILKLRAAESDAGAPCTRLFPRRSAAGAIGSPRPPQVPPHTKSTPKAGDSAPLTSGVGPARGVLRRAVATARAAPRSPDRAGASLQPSLHGRTGSRHFRGPRHSLQAPAAGGKGASPGPEERRALQGAGEAGPGRAGRTGGTGNTERLPTSRQVASGALLTSSLPAAALPLPGPGLLRRLAARRGALPATRTRGRQFLLVKNIPGLPVAAVLFHGW